MKPNYILGTVQFGLDYGINNSDGKVSPNEVNKILKLAKEHGIDTLDTAFSYGNAIERIGDFHKNSEYRFKINTKYSGSSDSSALNQLKNSLEILDVKIIDTYFFHSFYDFISNKNLVNELVEIKQIGGCQKIGVSIYENEEMEQCVNQEYIDVIQLPFNLLDNKNHRGDLITLAKKYNKEIQIRSVFLQGLFFQEIDKLPLKLAPLSKYILQLRKIAKLVDKSISELALAYVRKQKDIDYIIIGVDSAAQLKNNFFSSNYNLDDYTNELINNIIVNEKELLNPKNWK
jgi:aryl-alcohol dehydrogenase-like predicted oxidoreductase